MKTIILLCFAFLVMPCEASVLSGYVLNDLGLPIEYARVDVNGSHVFSDAAGLFVLDLPDGNYWVQVRAIQDKEGRHLTYVETKTYVSVSGNTTLNTTLREKSKGTVTTPGFGILSILVIFLLMSRFRFFQKTDFTIS